MPVACRLIDGRYKVVETETGKVVHDHGRDRVKCRGQASAINMSKARESTRRLTATIADRSELERIAEAKHVAAAGDRRRRRRRRGRRGGRQGNRRRATEGTVLSARRTSPKSYRARLGGLSVAQLQRDEDTLLGYLSRLAAAREARTSIEKIGRGWTGLELAVTLDAVRVTRSRASEALLGPSENPSMVERSSRDNVYPSKEGGIHAHRVKDDGSTELGGRHGHAVLYRGSIWFSEIDGAHEHAAGEEGRVDTESEHEHTIFMDVDGETQEIVLAGTTDHGHESLVGTTSLDGVHQHEAEIGDRPVKTLLPDEFRELFGAVESLRFAGEARESVGQAAVPTAGKSLSEWWGAGYGSPAVRKYLLPWVIGQAVRESAIETDVKLIVPTADLSDSAKWLLFAGEELLSAHEADEGLAAARESAALAIATERPRIELVERSFEDAGDGESCTRVAVFELRGEPDADDVEEAVLARAVESLLSPFVGRVVEARSDLERAWNLTVMEFGISDNDNFWPRSMGEKLLRVLEGAPLEAIEYRPHHFDHLPLEAVLRFPKGVVLNTVGQAQQLRIVESGGNMPTGKKLAMIMERMGMTEEEVRVESVGTIVGVGLLDGDRAGEAIHAKLKSADSRGRLSDYLGVSVDFQEAPFVPMFVPGMKRPLVYRTDVNEKARRAISFVTHPSAGGEVTAAA